MTLRARVTALVLLALLRGTAGAVPRFQVDPRAADARVAPSVRVADDSVAVRIEADTTAAVLEGVGGEENGAVPQNEVPHPDTLDAGPDEGRLWLVGGTFVAGNAAIMAYYFSTFYKDNGAAKAPMHSFNDWYNADLNVDKLGHIWGAQTYTHTLYYIFRWCNLRQPAAMIWSSSLSFVLQLEMELVDGLYAQWGFSWWDLAANAVGAVWPNVQRLYPSLSAVNLKMSYHPSPNVQQGWVEHSYLRDYDGFTYWLSVAPHDLLPASWRGLWPSWLALAVGYGGNKTMLGENVYNSKDGVGQGEQEWYIALDYDLRQLPGDTEFLRFVRESLNLFHLPAPAVRITPSGIWYGLYF